MDGNTIFLLVLASLAIAGAFFTVGYVVRKRFAERLDRKSVV